MTQKTVENYVEEAMNPETFDVLSYLDDQPVATDEITIYVDVAKARKFHKLVSDRKTLLEQRQADTQRGKASSLSLADDEEETEFDDEINALLASMEETALHFTIKSVAPALGKAIEKKFIATAPRDDAEALADHQRLGVAEHLAHAIASVRTGSGAVDDAAWTGSRLISLEDRLFPEQAQRLISALYDMVNTGYVFDEALTVDF